MNSKKFQLTLTALLLPCLATAAVAQMSGTSHPDESAPVQTDHYVKPAHDNDGTAPATVGTPAAYIDSYPATGPAPAQSPVLIPRQSAGDVAGALPPTPTTGEYAAPAVVVRQPAQTAYGAAASDRTLGPVTDDITSGVVVDVPMEPHRLNDGTLLRTRLQQTVATRSTAVGSVFSAELLQDVGHSGEVMLPAGSVVRGRVAAIHGGKRIGGPASIRLQPQTVTLPDGTVYALVADVVEVDGMADSHVNAEGSIQPKSRAKETAAAVGLSTVSAMAAGAVIGGGVGAAVGAAAGAGVATVVWLNQDHQESLPAGTSLIFALEKPLTVGSR